MTSSDSSNSSMGVSKDPTKPNDLQSKPYMPAWRPTLDEVLNNTTPPPYTLNEFVKYLSKNHCLETLEFILEARRYRESYKSLVEAAGESTVTTNSSSSVNLRMLYELLLTTYILPGAAREVNLSVNVRDALLRHKNMSTPPLPETLDPAVKNIHDLMEDSIFVSFLNSPSTFVHLDPTPGIGSSVAATFANKGYQVAIASRKGTGSKTSEGFLSLPADFANPDSVPALFNAVKSTFNATPSVVVYNAASLTPPPDNDSVLSIPAESVTADLNINTVSPYVAAQQAVQAWEGLPQDARKTFIYTGNMLMLPWFLCRGC
ncbi:regulator of G protein signaling domain protein [Penicillium canescens]|nr:regulator of G protein signaling domain protein [Penicillium canescens]